MTTVVISQPMLFPWPGFFELVASADIYVHLDDAYLSNGSSFTNRVQVKQAKNWNWMTIPIRRGGDAQLICDLSAADGSWRRQHRTMLSHALSKSPYLNDALSLFDCAYAYSKIVDLLITSIDKSAQYLGLQSTTEALRSSDMGITSKGSQRILEIVLALGGTRYVTAHGASNYLDHQAFNRSGVTVDYMNYSKTTYPQLHGDFLPYVTILDAIANLGKDASNIIRPATLPWYQFMDASA